MCDVDEYTSDEVIEGVVQMKVTPVLPSHSSSPRILIYECRCNERLKARDKGSTRLTYTGLRGGLEHLKTETRLRSERFESVKGPSEG